MSEPTDDFQLQWPGGRTSEGEELPSPPDADPGVPPEPSVRRAARVRSGRRAEGLDDGAARPLEAPARRGPRLTVRRLDRDGLSQASPAVAVSVSAHPQHHSDHTADDDPPGYPLDGIRADDVDRLRGEIDTLWDAIDGMRSELDSLRTRLGDPS